MAGRGVRHLRRGDASNPRSAGRCRARSGCPARSAAAWPTSTATTGTYFDVVYGKGAAALLAAREAAGAEAFDAALRCYVDANAWTIATPADVAVALADLPEALVVLAEAQALDKDDVPRRDG